MRQSFWTALIGKLTATSATNASSPLSDSPMAAGLTEEERTAIANAAYEIVHFGGNKPTPLFERLKLGSKLR